MGGKALKNTYTRRYTREEFDSVSKEVIGIIKQTFDKADTPLFYHNKKTFGDIDIIVSMKNTGKLPNNIRDYIQGTFNPNEIFHNGNCYSFDYKEVQVDFMTVADEHYNSNYHYLGFNDLGNYIGRIAHRLGLKYGQEGLWYNHYINDQNVGKVIVSKDYREIFNFLDLDYDRWLEGFDELEDTFKYVTTSKYFDTDMFQLKNLNAVNRERNLKRASYMSFLEWINNVYPHKVGDKLDVNLFKAIENHFPDANFTVKVRELEYEHAKKMLIKAKFNGGVLMRKYGLKGKEIGEAIQGFKDYVNKRHLDVLTPYFERWILFYSVEYIYEKFEKYLNDD